MHRRLVPRNDPRYKQLRERNNNSVKRSREKTRRERENTIKSINVLEQENQTILKNIQLIKAEYEQLNNLFKQHTGIDINQIPIKSSTSSTTQSNENSSTPSLTINTSEDKSSSNSDFDVNNLDGSIVLINGIQYKIVSINKN